MLQRVLKVALALSLYLVFQAPVWSAETKLDVSKLKPGDKLEYQTSPDQWEIVEFIGKGTGSNTLSVNRPPFARPMSLPISRLRLPQAAAQAPEKPPAADVVKTPRMWSDRTGGFKVEGVFLRVEAGNVVLKRTDTNTEIAVPLEKLSDADQKFVAGAKDADKPSESITLRPPRTSEDAAKDAEIAATNKSKDGAVLTATNYKDAKEIKAPESVAWSYQPDRAWDLLLQKPLTVQLRPGATFFDGPKRILPLPKEKKAFVVFEDHTPGNEAYATRVQACSLTSGKVEGTAVFGVGIEPIDISPDGFTVLARSSGFFASERTELRVYRRTGNTVKLVCAWKPYSTFGDQDDKKKSSRSEHDNGVEWAALVDNDHVFTSSAAGELVLWKISNLKPLYQMQLAWNAYPVLSGNRKYIVAPLPDSLVFLTALDGEIVGAIASELFGAKRPFRGSFNGVSLALTDDGTKLAVADHQQFRVWDLQTQKLERDFSILGLAVRDHASFRWISNKLLVLDGQTVIDADRRVPVLLVLLPAEVLTLAAGKAWYIDHALGRDSRALSIVPVPNEAMLANIAKVNPDDLLILRPGSVVGLDLQASGTEQEIEEARDALIERLIANNMSISPDAKIRLVASIQPTTHTVKYQRSGRFGAPESIESIQVSTLKLSLSFQIDGKGIWKYETGSSAPGAFWLKQGESLDQKIQHEMESRNQAINIKGFKGIPLPAFMAVMPKLKEDK